MFSSTKYCIIFNILAFGFSCLIITYTLGCIYTHKYISYYMLMFSKEHPTCIKFFSKIVISTCHVYTYKYGGEPATYREVIENGNIRLMSRNVFFFFFFFFCLGGARCWIIFYFNF